MDIYLSTTDPVSAIIWSASAFYCRTCAHIPVVDILFSSHQASSDPHSQYTIQYNTIGHNYLFLFIFHMDKILLNKTF